jgi:hypothetical protein
MGRMHRRYVTAALLLALAGCGANGDEKPGATPTTGTSETAPATSATPTGEPVTAKPTENILDWQRVTAGSTGRVISDGALTAVVDADGTAVRFTGSRTVTVPAGDGRRVSDVLISEAYAVVVAQDKLEEQPLRFTVLRASTGATKEISGPRPASGGPVALDRSILHYATLDDGHYCLASFDLAASKGKVTWCAPEDHGFSKVKASPAGLALQTFDDKRPISCRTLATVTDDGKLAPLGGVPDCKGWDALATGDGAVWSTIANERQVERGNFFASAGSQVLALGTGVTGSLTWCGDSAYFVRDAQKGGRAQLLRWTPGHTLEIAYESPGRGEAFLESPRCAGTVLTVSAYGEGGDEQVSANVPG